MSDAHANFAVSAVVTAPSPAASGTSLVVTAGHGTRFPAAPFNAVVHPSDADSTPANAEVVRVTTIGTDTLTITRAQEGSTARSIIVGDKIYAAITAKSFTDIEAVDAAAATGSLRTLGLGAAQALAGNTRLDQVTAPTAAVSANSQKITSLGTPTASTDAATKAYADSIAAGLDPHGSVKVATTANITLSGTQTIDGIAVIAADRVLVKNQTTTSGNGIYVVASGAWSRATDADTGAELTGGTFTFIEQGTQAEQGWVATHNGTPTLGTDPITFTQFTGGVGTLAGEVAGSGSATTITVRERLERYVDYVNGLDANDGLTPYRAKKTIQSAYNALKTAFTAGYTATANGGGVGVIELAPDYHDVGTGVVIDQDRPVEIRGRRSGWGRTYVGDFMSTIMSSVNPAQFILTGSTTAVSYGNAFYEMGFQVDPAVNTSLTGMLRTQANTFLQVERCSFAATGSTDLAVTGIVQNPGGSAQDNAWARIYNNRSALVALYKCETGTNFNRSSLVDNVVHYAGSLPAFHLQGDFLGGLVQGNNIEGNVTAFKLDANFCDHNTFIANNGECGPTTYPFYQINGTGQDNVFINGNCTCTAGVGTWIDFNNASASRNLVIGPFSTAGETAYKRKIIDISTTGNRIINTNYGIIQRYITGAGKVALADGDFAWAPPNGAFGFAHNTTTGLSYLSGRVNGTWKSVQIT